MRIYIRPLKNVDNVNAFAYSSEFSVYDGQPNDLYFQIVDLDRGENFRYMPVAGSSASLSFLNIDSSKQFERSGSQPFPLDPSIWKVSTSASELMTSGNVVLNLTENGITRKYLVQSVIYTNSTNVGSC
jgi:hypothetical protein